MSMGSIVYNSERVAVCDGSTMYYYGSVIFAVPPGEAYSFIATIFFPFKYIIWSCIGLIFVATMLVVGSLKLSSPRSRAFVVGARNDLPFFNMLTVCFGGAVTRLPTRNFARFLLLMWLTMSLVLKSAYQSKLFMFLQTEQRGPPMRTLDDVMQSDYDLFIMKSFYQSFYDNMPAERHR